MGMGHCRCTHALLGVGGLGSPSPLPFPQARRKLSTTIDDRLELEMAEASGADTHLLYDGLDADNGGAGLE